MNNRFPFKLKKENALQIIDIACKNWKERLCNKWFSLLYKDFVEITEEFYKEMRKECTDEQDVLFDKIFGKDNEIDFSILNDTDVFCGKVRISFSTDDFTCLFKSNNPFEKKVNVIGIKNNIIFNNSLLSKEQVIELRLATDVEKELYYKHYPEFKVGDWVYCINDLKFAKIKEKHPSLNDYYTLTFIDGSVIHNYHNNQLRLVTQKEIEEANKPIKGQLYFVKDNNVNIWNLRYAGNDSEFYDFQTKSGLKTKWDKWVKANFDLPE